MNVFLTKSWQRNYFC